MDTKICPKCKKEKPVASYKPNRSRPDGLQGWCISCDSGYHKEYYRKNRSRWRTKYRRSRGSCLERNKQYIWSILTKATCADCGHSDPRVLEFDHVRGDKNRDVSFLMRNASSIETLEAEINKCDIVCANCHRIRTYTHQGSYRIRFYGNQQ